MMEQRRQWYKRTKNKSRARTNWFQNEGKGEIHDEKNDMNSYFQAAKAKQLDQRECEGEQPGYFALRPSYI